MRYAYVSKKDIEKTEHPLDKLDWLYAKGILNKLFHVLSPGKILLHLMILVLLMLPFLIINAPSIHLINGNETIETGNCMNNYCKPKKHKSDT